MLAGLLVQRLIFVMRALLSTLHVTNVVFIAVLCFVDQTYKIITCKYFQVGSFGFRFGGLTT